MPPLPGHVFVEVLAEALAEALVAVAVEGGGVVATASSFGAFASWPARPVSTFLCLCFWAVLFSGCWALVFH